jgi:drug/metabolite transporter superfamily protein YnfA
MEQIIPYAFAAFLIFSIQFAVYLIFKKTKQFWFAMVPNAGLFVLGLIVAFIILLTESQGNTFADLGAIVIVMLTMVATILSIVTSSLMIFLLRKQWKQ